MTTKSERASASTFLIERRRAGEWQPVARCHTQAAALADLTTRQFADCRVVEESRLFGRALVRASKLFPNDTDVRPVVVHQQPDTRTPAEAFAEEFGGELI